MATAVFSLATGSPEDGFIDFLAFSDKTDSSTVELGFRTGRLCRTDEPCLDAANPRFTYHVVSFDLLGDPDAAVGDVVDIVTGKAKFNAWAPSISTGAFEELEPGDTVGVPITVDAAEWALTPTLGVMEVAIDDRSGPPEADLICSSAFVGCTLPKAAAPPVTPPPPPPPPPPPTPAPTADLGIAKSTNPGTLRLGSGNITYTLSITNHGPSTATGVVVADQLPPTVTFVSATSSQGTCSQASGVVTCPVGTMTSGATVTITIVVRPTAVGTIGNTATVISQVADPNPANNTGGASTIVQGVPRTPAVPRPAVCSSLVVTPRQMKVGKRRRSSLACGCRTASRSRVPR